MNSKFGESGEERYLKKKDEQYPHSYNLAIQQDKLIPGRFLELQLSHNICHVIIFSKPDSCSAVGNLSLF